MTSGDNSENIVRNGLEENGLCDPAVVTPAPARGEATAQEKTKLLLAEQEIYFKTAILNLKIAALSADLEAKRDACDLKHQIDLPTNSTLFRDLHRVQLSQLFRAEEKLTESKKAELRAEKRHLKEKKKRLAEFQVQTVNQRELDL
jgi:hypothetical protein